MKTLACAWLVLLLALPATAQAQNTKDPKAWAEQFLNTIVEDGSKRANELLLNGTALGAERPDAIRGINENMSTVEAFYGKATSYEMLAEKKWGGSILVFIAIVKREKIPIFWRLVFYRYNSSWNLVHFDFRDKFDGINSFSLI